jgi:hypothetical protein
MGAAEGPRRRIHLRSFLVTVAIVGTLAGLVMRAWNELRIAGVHEQARQRQLQKERITSYYLWESHMHSVLEKSALDLEQIMQDCRKKVARLSNKDSRETLGGRIDELETGIMERAVWHSTMSKVNAQVAANPSKPVDLGLFPPEPLDNLGDEEDANALYDRISEITRDISREFAAELELRSKENSGSVSRFLPR